MLAAFAPCCRRVVTAQLMRSTDSHVHRRMPGPHAATRMSLFELIGALTSLIAVLGYVNHRFVRLPDTIGITAMGLVLSLVLALVGARFPDAVSWASSFADRLDITEIVFHGL